MCPSSINGTMICVGHLHGEILEGKAVEWVNLKQLESK